MEDKDIQSQNLAEEKPQPEKNLKENLIGKGERRWYVLSAKLQGIEKVKESLEKKIKQEEAKDEEIRGRVLEILLPMKEVVAIKGGKKISKAKPIYGGYIFIEIQHDEDETKDRRIFNKLIEIITSVPGVRRFVGSGGKPEPLSEEEVKNIKEITSSLGKEKPKLEHSFERGTAVRIISGPFNHFVGVVEDVNEEKARLRVMVAIFGRSTPVELEFDQVEKI
jgi:transcriptional antiterminator NusG